MKKLVVASKNPGKIREFTALLPEYTIISLLDLEDIPDIIENGSTFIENALKKAESVYNYTKLNTIADDSGLEIDYLNGKPGFHSSRFLGENTTDLDRNKKILKLLKDVPDDQRTARFKCELAFKNDKELKIFSGVVEGRISYKIKGNEGFGYDPIFIPFGYDRTFGEIGKTVKDRISHRAVSLKKFKEWLKTS